MTLSKLQFRLLLLSNLGAWSLLVFFVLTGFISADKPEFEEITAKRVNIVNDDGTIVIAIANKQRVAAPRFDGHEYPVAVSEGRQYMAGMIFFNEQGDEMGGLVFNSFKLPNGRVAGIGHLSFDRFNDNQVISLEYNENRRGVKSGLTFYDRPGDGSFVKSLDFLEEAYFGEPSPERLQVIKDSLNMMRAQNAFGAERVFIGSKNEEPQLLLKDTKGNPRLRMIVDSSDMARLQFLDAKGKLISEFPKQ